MPTALGTAIGVPFARPLGKSPASRDEIVQWLYGTADGSVIDDKIGVLDDAQVAERPCLQMDGLDYITVPGLSVTDKVTLVGWEFGEEKVANSGFDSDLSSWTTSGTWVWTNGVAKHNTGNSSSLYQANLAENLTDTYLVTYTVSGMTAGTIRAQPGSSGGTSRSANGSYFEAIAFDTIKTLFMVPSTTFDGSIDNVSVKEITSFGGSTAIPTVSSGQIDFTAGTVAGILINDVLRYVCEEGSGDKLYPVDGSGVVATLVSPTQGIANMWTGTCDEASWNAQYGYTSDGGTNIPALADGSADAAGGAIQYHGGFVHNGGGYKIEQTDTGFFDAGTVNFYSADGSTIDNKTYADFLDHYNNCNGEYNLWVRLVSPYVVEAVQYPLDKEWTVAEYIRNVKYFGGTPLIPYPVTSGGIGPGGTYYTYDGTHLLLVRDA